MSLNPRRSFRDCHGIDFIIVPLPSNGVCGFSALSYVLSGHENDFGRVIEDLCVGFHRNPIVFTSQTDFGQMNANISEYRNSLCNAIRDIGFKPLPQLFWLNDGHLIIFSMMFDITLFVYNVAISQWLVYNEGSW